MRQIDGRRIWQLLSSGSDAGELITSYKGSDFSLFIMEGRIAAAGGRLVAGTGPVLYRS